MLASPFVKGEMRGISNLTFAKMDYSIVNDGLFVKNNSIFAIFKFKNPTCPL